MARTLDGVGKRAYLGGDGGQANLADDLQAGNAGIEIGHGRRAGLEAAGAGRWAVMVDIHGKDVGLGEPAAAGGKQAGQQLLAHIEPGQAGRSEQVFERTADKQVHVHGLDVQRLGA